MKTMYKTIILFLVFCMCMIPLAGCANEGNIDGNGTDSSNGTTDSVSGGNIGEIEVPPHVTYDGTPVVILAWNAFMTDFVLEEEESHTDKVSEALWTRNLNVQDQLDVTIEYITIDGHYAKMNEFLQTMEASISVGDSAFDLVQQYSLTGALATTRGLYLDLMKNNEINLTGSEWWSSDLVDELAFNNKLYFASGDISPTVLGLAMCIYFNKQMIVDLGLENPYDLLESNQWTWDKFFEMCDNVHVDLGESGVVDDDRFGFITTQASYDGMYHSIGQRLIGKNDEGKFIVSKDVRSDKTATFAARMMDFLDSEDVYKPAEELENFLDTGRLLFEPAYAGTNYENVRRGIMPLPKYSAEQERYYTILNMNHSLFSIPYDTPNFEISGAVMEFLARESYKIVTPALFEDTFKAQYAEAPEDAAVYDLIRSSITWDIGRTYGEELGGLYSAFRHVIEYRGGEGGIGSHFAGAEEAATYKLSELVTTFEGLKR